MESRAKALGHPIHPMLIVFPLGLLGTSFIFDVVHAIWGNEGPTMAAYWCIMAGLVGGLVAAVFGLWDYLAIPAGTRAKRIGLLHGAGNLVVMVLFFASFLIRFYDYMHHPGTAGMVLSALGLAVSGVSGWLGGELVDRLGVGVDPGANLDAPSSLSGAPAAPSADELGMRRSRRAA